MLQDTPNDALSPWQHGMLRCRVESRVSRINRKLPYTFTEPDEQSEDILHTQSLLDSRTLLEIPDIGEEIERRMFYELVEFGIKKSVWPIAPIVWWHRWDAERREWVVTVRPGKKKIHGDR